MSLFRWLNELDKRALLSKNLDMVCNVRMALRLDPDTGMITIRGYGDDSKVISLRLASLGDFSYKAIYTQCGL